MKVVRALLPAILWLVSHDAAAAPVTIPAGTRVFGELQEQVTSDVKQFEVGQTIEARVWRNIVVDGRTVVAAGAPMVVQVANLRKRKTFGRAGSVELRAVSLQAVDGTEIFLDGGYDKKGESRIVLSSTLFALVAWPTAFIKGKQAVLEPGMIFDASIPAQTRITVSDDQPHTIRLAAPSVLTAEILYDEMSEGAKELPMSLRLCDRAWTDPVQVTAVNEEPIEPIDVEISERGPTEGCEAARGSLDLKALSKHLSKGINRFSVSIGEAASEVLLDVEM